MTLTQREYEGDQRAHRREHEAEQRAVNLAVTGVERRLEALNELRKDVITDRNQFVTASTHKVELDALKIELRGRADRNADRIDALEKISDRAIGSLNTWRGIAAFLGLGGVGAVIWAILQAQP